MKVKTFFSIILIIVAVYFLVRTLITNWSLIPFSELYFNPKFLLLSFFFLYLNFIISVLGWQNILPTFNLRIDFSTAYWIMSTSQIAKYIPGGIWFTVSRMQLAGRANLREEPTAFSVVVETCLIFLTGIILLFLAMLKVGNIIDFKLLLPLLIVSILLLYPPFLRALANLAMTLLKRPKVYFNLPLKKVLTLCIFYFGVWFFQIVGFFFLIRSFYALPFKDFPTIALTYIASWIGGFVVIYAPGGIGIREGIMSFLLSKNILLGLAVGISIIARAWTSIYELIVFLTAQLLVKKKASLDF
ncbi:hypothetical protein DRP53_01405 [candidate division WOR-3 bacterium]|uniref:Flippase-like domain-containing protein n=1 Tax=candidate division WOR-3 bacterium TaxID=2052148 RepID=A0A660SLS6_UNCW3|nr:MAG: hypothetical protein DRP53_01405 [candidate division WOR-3 bacterium]